MKSLIVQKLLKSSYKDYKNSKSLLSKSVQILLVAFMRQNHSHPYYERSMMISESMIKGCVQRILNRDSMKSYDKFCFSLTFLDCYFQNIDYLRFLDDD